MWRKLAAILLIAGLANDLAQAGQIPFDLPTYVPPIVADSKAPQICTVTYMVADLANNDIFAVRMRIAPSESDVPAGNRLPCPKEMPPRVGVRALDVCRSRSGDAKYCVFADMSRGFEREPELRNTAENAARCASDRTSDIAVACWMAGKLPVCDVGCGNSPPEAVAAARTRCEEKHQRTCAITASVPISGP